MTTVVLQAVETRLFLVWVKLLRPGCS
jgi:hypothetical protein